MDKKPNLKPKTYPLKPKRPEGFKKAVAWFGGREFIASLKGVVMYAIYGESSDPRPWMKANLYPDDVENAAPDKMTSAEIDRAWAEKIYRYWKWKHDNFLFWREWLEQQLFWKKLSGNEKSDGEDVLEEFWFDYIADSGDGQMGVYSVACLCLSDLWAEEDTPGARVEMTPENARPGSKLLPRGYFLFVGGDTAYHAASYQTLFERFQTPFRWAFTSVRESLFRRDKNLYRPETEADEIQFLFEGEIRKVSEKPDQWDGTKISYDRDGKMLWDEEPPRPLFGIPANHDYYDSIEGFNRQFRRSPYRDVGENMALENNQDRIFLQIPTFSREQEASYVALRLPFDWYFFGIDSENENLDIRQKVFFKQIMENCPKRLIFATPEPTTVFGRESSANDKTGTYLKIITEKLGLRQPFREKGQITTIDENDPQKAEKLTGVCRLDLSGDVHHYARYWGPPDENSGTENPASPHYASVVAGGGGAFFDTTSTLIDAVDDDGLKRAVKIPPQKLYPDEGRAIARTADRLFDLWNIKGGGYIQHAGVVSAILIFFFLTHYSNVSTIFNKLEGFIKDNGAGAALSSLRQHLIHPSIYANPLETQKNLCAGIILIAALGLTWLAALRINALIKNIKDKILKAEVPENAISGDIDPATELLKIGRIRQLFITSTPFFASVLLYAFFIFLYPSGGLRLEVTGFTNSLFLLLHVAAAGLMIWLSFEYTNWMAVKFKLNRRNPQKTFTEKLEDPNEDPDEFLDEAIATSKRFIFRILKKSAVLKKLASYLLKLFGFFSREYSYQYFPAIALVALAVAALAFGIGNFGDEALGVTFADLILVFFVGGEAYLLSYVLGSQTGAAYLDAKGRRLFFALGLWHAVLQILTPFVVYRYASWKTALLIFAVLILFNGFSALIYLIEGFLPRKKTEITDERKKTDPIFPFGAWLMKYLGRKKPRASARAFFAVWLILGAFVLVAPLTIFRSDPSLDALLQTAGSRVSLHAREFSQWIAGFGDGWTASVFEFISALVEKFGERSYLGFAFLLLGFIGYRLSRIWFSWYLGVSVLFNGHNNEAGGMARIEGFKHILRIRITKNLLTVYVIGLDEACDDLSKLKSARLVDKFHLTPYPPPAPENQHQ